MQPSVANQMLRLRLCQDDLSLLTQGFIEKAIALHRESVNFEIKSNWQLRRIHI